MYRFTLILTFVITICSCNLSPSESTKITYKKDYKEALRIHLSNNYSSISKSSSDKKSKIIHSKWTDEFYSSLKFLPIWITDSNSYGLDSNVYSISELVRLKNSLDNTLSKDDRFQDAALLEITLTTTYFLFGKHLNYGITPKDSTYLFTDIPRKKFNINMVQHLLKANKSDSVIIYLLSLQPPHKEYKNLQKGLKKHLVNNHLSKEKVKVDPFRKDSLLSYQQSRKALILHNYLNQNDTDSSYFEALTKFQIEHGLFPDNLIGKNTASALSKSPHFYYKSIAASLERWRWKEEWGKDYIYVNIASYQLKVYQNNEMVKKHKVVVGKNSTRTPEIDDEMEYMIVYPYWNLPYSISSKETLAKVKKDSTYLNRNNFEVFTNKRKKLDANKIDWSKVTADNFNYKIRQKGGGSNSLGLIKFIFPNKHSVYFHDTPSKRFFKKDLRAYSHGCVRVQSPIDLAGQILASDNNDYNMDSVNVYIKRKRQKKITLNKELPVHIHYLTCEYDNENNLIFYKDIYKKDTDLAELMFSENQFENVTSPELVNK